METDIDTYRDGFRYEAKNGVGDKVIDEGEDIGKDKGCTQKYKQYGGRGIYQEERNVFKVGVIVRSIRGKL